MEFDYIIIGAGAAGLSFAALMEKRGYKVAVLEAHALPGGCSSFFERDGYIFDAGATTLSGLKEGRPLQRLMAELNLNLELKAIDPGIVSLIGNKKVRRFKNFEKWIDELSTNFPDINHHKLWQDLNDIESYGWELSSQFKNIPLRSLKSLSPFLTLKLATAIKAAPNLFRSVENELNKLAVNDHDYLRMIDELLFITSQNNMKDTPLLMGAMGLNYPEDTSYAMGGMKAFSEALASKCSSLFFKHKVQKIIPIKNGLNGFEVVTTHGHFKSKNVVSTIPIWNHLSLFDDRKGRDFFARDQLPDSENCWSAFMIYLTIPLDEKRESLYYQIHCSDIPNCHTKSFFVSISHPEDKTRSINGRQVVTISTHTKASEWLDWQKNKAHYQIKKNETKDYILNLFKEKFRLDDNDLQNVMTGSPGTFVRYTKRYSGLVGGIPHSLKRNPIDFIFARSPYKNFYMIGDTQFPGQGIAAVILGAFNLADYLKSDSTDS